MDALVVLIAFLGLVALIAVVIRNGRGTEKRSRPVPTPRTRYTTPPLRVVPKQRAARQTEVPASLHGPARIIDGNSLVIQKTQVRLFGVDAPEMDHPHGNNAKWALINLCKGKKIRAEVTQKDIHGRTVARCYLPDGRDLSAEMVRVGFAIDWPKYSGGIYRALEVPDARKKMWLADARQKGRMDVWERFELNRKDRRP